MSARTFSLLVFVVVLTISSEIAATSAQNGSSAAPVSATPTDQNSTTKGSTATSTEKPEKKVWTNDDLGALQNDIVNSTGVEHAAQPAGSRQKVGNPKGRSAKWYHDQIAKLQVRIPPLDSQIAQLQSAINGKPTGNTKTSQRPTGVRSDDWSLELAQFQAERDDVMSKISALEDEARHNGIPESALR